MKKQSMKEYLSHLYHNDIIRYVFFGGCTTMVNLISFFLLRKIQIPLNAANLISIILAILFAYVVNSKYVFQNTFDTFHDHLRPFAKFLSARAATMIIELFGVWLFAEVIQIPEMAGKFITQFVVLILNYVFSKFFVFTSKKSGAK